LQESAIGARSDLEKQGVEGRLKRALSSASSAAFIPAPPATDIAVSRDASGASVGFQECTASSISVEPGAITTKSSSTTQPLLVDSSVQCDPEDLLPLRRSDTLMRNRARLIESITRRCLHCGALPEHDAQQIFHDCPNLQDLPLRRSSSELVPCQETPPPQDIVRSRSSSSSGQPAGILRSNDQLCRPTRSTATSLRTHQEMRDADDASLLSRCVSFTGRDTSETAVRARMRGEQTGEEVMCNRGELAEYVEPDCSAADLKQYWQSPSTPCTKRW